MHIPPIDASNSSQNGGSLISPVVGDTKDIGIPTTKKIRITKRYLSTDFLTYKTIYLFDLTCNNGKHMAKVLEIIGLCLIGIMSLAFVGAIPQIEPGLSPLFWACAGGTLVIIFYRKKRKQDHN
jgi:hypothetical protein